MIRLRPSFPLLAAACAVLAALAFLPGLTGGFFFDDKPNITQNWAVRIVGIDHYSLWYAALAFPSGEGLRPLAMLSFALDFWLHGPNPVAFKLTNLLIHVLTTAALAMFLRRLLKVGGRRADLASTGALLLAMAWALHPLQVSSVLYVVQRMQTLSTLFLVMALWSYLQARLKQIDGTSSRREWIWTSLMFLLALASKEDAIMFPAYALCLELTVLRFRAATPSVAVWLRRSYLAMTVAGTVLFLLVVVPRFWSSSTYPGRDFNSMERLLTQAQVLTMYLGQILLPLPDRLPFYYDNLTPSRGLLAPISTLWSLLLLLALMGWAWCWRNRRPLFALGVLLFFAGHFVTSNVLGLELAFEHRNHFPLIGIVLAVGDLLVVAGTRLRLPPRPALAICLLLVALSATATTMRARDWRSPLRMAEKSTQIAPGSTRAWQSLCRAHYDLSASTPSNPNFDKAIHACEQGGQLPGSATMLANVVILKSIRGDVAQADWDRLLQRLRQVTMNTENAGVADNLVDNTNRGIPLNIDGVAQAIAIVSQRAKPTPVEHVHFGFYLLDKPGYSDAGYRHLQLAVNALPPKAPLTGEILAALKARGRTDLAEALAAHAQSIDRMPASH